MTSIEWTKETWNPVVGCSRVSEGCRNCYAERQAFRNAAMGWDRYQGITKKVGREIRWTGVVRLVPEALDKPLRWKKPRKVFVNSMSDLFHESLRYEDIARVYAAMAQAPQHTFQVLTKRPERRRAFYNDVEVAGWRLPLPNVWEGVSVEDQKTADERIPLLLQTPAAVRWVSYEPALGPVEFRGRIQACEDCDPCLAGRPDQCAVGGFPVSALHPEGVSWVVVGGESGPGARPFDLAWARSTVAQCKAAGVPVFVKQLGSRAYSHNCDDEGGVCDCAERLKLSGKGGDPSEWPEDLRVREFPA